MTDFQVRIGINPLSWMNDDLPSLGGETPLDVALTEGRAIGYKGFELGNKFPREPAALKALLAQYDLSLVSGWYSGRLARTQRRAGDRSSRPAPGTAGEKRRERHGVRRSRRIRSRARRVPLYQRPRFFTEAQWDTYAQRLDRFAQYTLAHGVRVAYHHHMGAYVETPADVENLMKRTSDAVGLLFDTGHITFAGGDPLATLEAYAPRICHVHCKDVRPEVVKLARNRDWSFLESVINGAFTVPGDGAVDFAAVIAGLKRHGYRGWLVVEAEQDPTVAPSFEYAQLGYRTLRSLVDAAIAPEKEPA